MYSIPQQTGLRIVGEGGVVLYFTPYLYTRGISVRRDGVVGGGGLDVILCLYICGISCTGRVKS